MNRLIGGTRFSNWSYPGKQRVPEGTDFMQDYRLWSLGQTVTSPAGSISGPGMMRRPRSKPDRWHPAKTWSQDLEPRPGAMASRSKDCRVARAKADLAQDQADDSRAKLIV